MSKFIVNKNDSKIRTVTNETINGIAFTISTNLATPALADLSTIKMKVNLTQDGKKTDTLFPESISLKTLLEILFANNLTRLDDTLKLMTFPVYFGTALNLKNGQGIMLEIENGGMSTDGTKTCTLTVETIPAIGVQEFIPKIEEIVLDPQQTEFDLNIGSAVHKVLATRPDKLTRIAVESDKLSADHTGAILRLQLLSQLDWKTGSEDFQNLQAVVGSEKLLNSLKLKLIYSDASTRSLWVMRRIITPEIAQNFVQKSAEHHQENVKAIKTTSKEDCACNH